MILDAKQISDLAIKNYGIKNEFKRIATNEDLKEIVDLAIKEQENINDIYDIWFVYERAKKRFNDKFGENKAYDKFLHILSDALGI